MYFSNFNLNLDYNFNKYACNILTLFEVVATLRFSVSTLITTLCSFCCLKRIKLNKFYNYQPLGKFGPYMYRYTSLQFCSGADQLLSDRRGADFPGGGGALVRHQRGCSGSDLLKTHCIDRFRC